MEQVVFGIHTGTFKHVISQKESNAIKGFFNCGTDEPLEDETFFYDKGITQIGIQEIPGKDKIRYYLYMRINFSRTLGIGNHKIMPYTIPTIKRSFKVINKFLRLLPLTDKNNLFSEWKEERIDPAFDIYEPHTTLLMQFLNQSVNLDNQKKKCERIPIQGKTAEQLIYESMRFGNKSYTYNVYNKLLEVFDKAKKIDRIVTPEELKEVRGILRIERQSHISGIKKLCPTQKAGDLLKADVRNNILQTMIEEIAIFFGKEDYYSSSKISKALPGVKADINKISSSEIKKDDVEKYGIDFMQGVYNRIIKAYPRPPDKRQYNSFPIPHRTGDGRMSANISLYSVTDGKRTITVAGRTLEDFEDKVLCKLKEVYLTNRLYLKSNDPVEHSMISKSSDYIKRFYEATQTETAKQDAENFIESVIQIDEERFSDCPSVSGGS